MHDPKHQAEHIRMTQPDFRLFIPRRKDYESDNVHVQIIDHPQFGGLIAFWTQSTLEGAGDNHLVLSYSRDNGVTWSEPQFIIGARETPERMEKQASWCVPVVSKSGRIYLFYFRETDFVDNTRQISAAFSCIYSDDFGQNWSEPVDIPMRVTPFDAGPVQNNCIYQLPRRGPDGKYLIGYTKWASYHVLPPNDEWCNEDSRLYFIRLENIDDDPDPEHLRVTHLPEDENGVALDTGNGRSSAQEPCMVTLPDGRLFCVMRTIMGSVYYTVSDDLGKTWRTPEPLRFDDGSVLAHPLSPAPLYELMDGRYVQLFHNHSTPTTNSRNPVYKVYGTYDPDAWQPIRFPAGTQELYMRLPDRPSGLSLYSCHTTAGGRDVLWYPDRKFFLLGKKL